MPVKNKTSKSSLIKKGKIKKIDTDKKDEKKNLRIRLDKVDKHLDDDYINTKNIINLKNYFDFDSSDEDNKKNANKFLDFSDFENKSKTDNALHSITRVDKLNYHRSTNIQKKLAISFMVVVFALCAIVSYFTLVKASVFLTLKDDSINDKINFTVYDGESNTPLVPISGETELKYVKGVVRDMDVEKSKVFTVSGGQPAGEDVSGVVSLINNYSSSQALVATTRLLSSTNVLFRLKNNVVVPAGGKIEAEVYAENPLQTNVVGNDHFTIPGLWAGLQDKIYAESKEGDIQYKMKYKNILTEDDVNKAVINLKEDLINSTKTEIANIYKDYNEIIYTIDDASISKVVTGKIGDEVEQFSVNLKMKINTVAFNNSDISDLIKERLESVIPDNKQLTILGKDNFSYTTTNFDAKDKKADLSVNFIASMSLKPNIDLVDKNKIAGLNKAQLESYLNNIPEIEKYRIVFTPSFIHKVPSLVDKIEISVSE